MKRCTACNRTYPDAQTFCIEDGTPLVDDTTTAPAGAPNYQQQAYQQQQAPIAQQPYAPMPYPQSTGMQPPQQNFQSAQYQAGSGSKSSRKGLFIALGLVAISFIGMAAIVIGLELWNNGTISEVTGSNKPTTSGTYSDTNPTSSNNPTSSSNPTSTQTVSFANQVGSWKLTKTAGYADLKQKSEGLLSIIMTEATSNAGAFYTGPGGKQIFLVDSTFSSPDRARAALNETYSKIRSTKEFKIFEDDSWGIIYTGVEGNTVGIAIGTTGTNILLFMGSDVQSVTNFIDAQAVPQK